jgi:hypothetical protein
VEKRVRKFLHWLLFRAEHYELVTARINLASIDQRYGAMVTSLVRTPAPDSEWMDKFLALEKEYEVTLKDWQDARVKYYLLRRQVRHLGAEPVA